MSASTGNGDAATTKSVPLPAKSPIPLPDRLLFHEKLHKQSRCDLETPASLISNVNIKQLLTPAAFDSLPTHYQNELIRLLPETDRISVDYDSHAMSVNSLSNEFFAKSCVEYRDRLRNGEFTSSALNKVDTDPVVWECDELVLRQRSPRPEIPKAGDAFISSSRRAPSTGKHKTERNGEAAKKLKSVAVTKLRKATTLEKLKHANSLVSKPAVKPVKVEAISPPKPANKHVSIVQKAVTKPKPTVISNLQSKESLSVQTQVAGVKRSISDTQNKVKSPTQQPNKVVITQFKKVTENNRTGEKVTRVVPIVVRNPHGQVVTTLANCNPLLSQMIKNPIRLSQTMTTPPVRVVEKKPQSLLPTILKRNNQVIVTLRSNPKIVTSRNGVNKAVSEVISKVHPVILQKPTNNIPSTSRQQQPIIVTVNGGNNGSMTDKLITTAVNLQRSREICDKSKDVKPTLDLERSYEICKKVLGNTGAATIVMIGADGKRTTISKAVRNRNAAASGSNHSGIANTDIPIYRSKHRGKSSLTLSGHLFLALRQDDDDGYALKAYKRKAAYKQRQKKKGSKGASKKQVSGTSASSSTSQTTTDTQTLPASTDISQTTLDSSSSVTMVTGTLHSTVPITSVKEDSSITGAETNNNNQGSLLDTCMCSKRALVICRKCGAFSHAECMDMEECLACLQNEN